MKVINCYDYCEQSMRYQCFLYNILPVYFFLQGPVYAYLMYTKKFVFAYLNASFDIMTRVFLNHIWTYTPNEVRNYVKIINMSDYIGQHETKYVSLNKIILWRVTIRISRQLRMPAFKKQYKILQNIIIATHINQLLFDIFDFTCLILSVAQFYETWQPEH